MLTAISLFALERGVESIPSSLHLLHALLEVESAKVRTSLSALVHKTRYHLDGERYPVFLNLPVILLG